MILPDVNVLIYAFRRDVSQHRVCRPWLASVISNDARPQPHRGAGPRSWR